MVTYVSSHVIPNDVTVSEVACRHLSAYNLSRLERAPDF